MYINSKSAFIAIIVLCALIVVLIIQFNKIRDYEAEVDLYTSKFNELRVQRELAHKRTVDYKHKLDSLIRVQKTTPEIVYIIKTKYNEKINSINALSDDEHILFLSKWLPEEDSIRRRYIDTTSSIANRNDKLGEN